MSHRGLRRSLGLVQYFSLSFGAIVGVGWIVLLGQWLEAGGPLGTIIGFALGGVIMGLIGRPKMRRMPGRDTLYACRIT